MSGAAGNPGAVPPEPPDPPSEGGSAPSEPRILSWEERSSPEIEAILRKGAVAILPVGAIEPHGPHLPLSTDVVIAEGMARRGAARLRGAGVPALVLPPLAWTVAEWSSGFAGRLSVRPSTARALLSDIFAAAAEAGARAVALANAHLEPAHVACLREACVAATANGLPVVFPDLTRRANAARLGEAFVAGDHGGRFETSLVLAERPDLVDDAARLALPRETPGLVERIRAGATSFREAGLPRGYCGDPASASAEEGRRLYEILAEVLEGAVRDALAGTGLGGQRT